MAFPAEIDLDTLDGEDGFTFTGNADESAGIAVSSAGDVNGDGIDDFIVGAFGGDSGAAAEAGAAYVIFGTASGFNAALTAADLDGTNGFRISGSQAGGRVGISVASAGDVNGDDIDDLVIGGYLIDITGAPDAGLAYVMFGTDTGFAADLNLDTIDGSNGFKLAGESSGDQLGRSVAGIGDINDDGFDDVAFGAPYAGGTGEAYVVFGSDQPFDATLRVFNLNGGNGFTVEGVSADDETGWAVSSAGDVNGDTIDDFIVSAHRSDPGGELDAGKAYVIFGTDAGFLATFNPAALDGSNGFEIVGAASGDQTGISVAEAGDMNGDGIGDIVVGAQFFNDGSSAGAAYLIYGTDTGFSAAIDVAALDGVDGTRFDGAGTGDRTGRSVSGIGDFNGDGLDDLLIGAPYSVVDGVPRVGEAYIVFGSETGFGATYDLALLDGSNGLLLVGVDSAAQTGFATGGGADIDGDGYADVIVGAPNAAAGDGEAYIVFGDTSNDLTATTGDDTLIGGNGNDVIDGGEGNDTIDGRLGDDDMTGGPGNDTFVVRDAGDTVNENPGEGTDLVRAYVDWTLGDNVENLYLYKNAANGTGNGQDNDIFANSAFAGVTLNGLGGDDFLRGSKFNDTLNGGDDNDRIFGDDGDDELNGDAGNDVLFGGNGVDTLNGGDDDDNLLGGAGNDTLNGGAGQDVLNGESGADAMSGGSGDDLYYVDNTGDTVSEGVDAGYDTVRARDVNFTLGNNVEELVMFGTAFIGAGNTLDNVISASPATRDVNISGLDGNDSLRGSKFGDVLNGGLGDDRLFGDDGDDRINGNLGDDVLIGGDGFDTMYGGDNDDTLIGGAGDDLLRGDAGQDTMVGGADADVFYFRNGDFSGSTLGSADRIRDYSRSDGDIIDLTQVDADTTASGDQSFTFIGEEVFSGTAGELRFEQSGAFTLVEMDVDGDGLADHAITFDGTIDLVASDFFL